MPAATAKTVPELTTFRWSSSAETHRRRMAFINNYFRGVIGTPFGGTKYSGYGREHAIETLREFTYTKMVRFPSGLGTIPSWRAVSDIFDDVA